MNAATHSNALARHEDFSSKHEIMSVVETASSAAAAQAKAMVESRYIMAMRKPRIWDQVRQDLMAECKRPAFANNKSAYYHKPIGNGVEGLGIRFAEVALRCMTNVLVETTMIFEDDAKEVHRVSVTDLESNITYPLDVRVSRTVERSKPMDDGSYISVRTNSYKKSVYTVPATDDDLLNKRGALISKAIRTLALRIVPGDLQDEAETIIKKIRLDEATADPTAARKAIADGFAEIGVKVVDLVEYLGHPLDTCSPPEMVQLRALYGAIRDGEATWKEAVDNKAKGGDDGGGAGAGEKKTYDAELFKKSLPKWADLIKTGKKTPAQIIAMAGTKAPLTDEQRKTIEAIKPDVKKGDGETTSLLDDVKRICAAAIAIEDSETAFVKLDDARFMLQEMNAENQALAVAEIDAAVVSIKSRKEK